MEITFLSYFFASLAVALSLPLGFVLGWVIGDELKAFARYTPFINLLDQRVIYSLFAVLFFLGIKIAFVPIGSLLVIYSLVAGANLFSKKIKLTNLIAPIALFCAISNLVYLAATNLFR